MPVSPLLVNRVTSLFPPGPAPVADDKRLSPGVRARVAAHSAFKTAQQYLMNVNNARNFNDPEVAEHIIPELRDSVIMNLRSNTQDRFSDPSTGLVRIAERANDAAAAATAPFRPKLDPDSTAQMIRTDQSWNNHILPMLNGGKSWDQIIPTLDADGLLAVQRFAPGFEASSRSRFDQAEVPSVLAGINNLSEQHLPKIAPPEGRTALLEHQDTQSTLGFIRNVAGWITTAGPRDVMGVSIGLTRAAYGAGVQSPVDVSPYGQAAYHASLADAAR